MANCTDPYTYKSYRPQWLPQLQNPNEEALWYTYGKNGEPRVGRPTEVGDGTARAGGLTNTARYRTGDIVQHVPITVGPNTCMITRKAGPTFDALVPVEMTGGAFVNTAGVYNDMYIAAHDWEKFNRECEKNACRAGPLYKLCKCGSFQFTFGNLLADGTVLNATKFTRADIGHSYGLYFDNTLHTDGVRHSGYLVINPSTKDAAGAFVKIIGMYQDEGDFRRPSCDGLDNNPRVIVEFLNMNTSPGAV